MTTIAAATMPAVEATAPVTKVSKFLPNCAALARSLVGAIGSSHRVGGHPVQRLCYVATFTFRRGLEILCMVKAYWGDQSA